MKKGILISIAAVIVGLMIYSWVSDGTWYTEEVRLSSGKVIRVSRVDRYKTVGGIGDRSNSLMRARLKVISGGYPGRKWDEAAMQPLLLEEDRGTLVLVGNIHGTASRYSSRYHVSPYVQFRLTTSGWIEEPVSKKFFGRPSNLLYGGRPHLLEKIGPGRKAELNKTVRTFRSDRMIDPEAVRGVGIP